MSAASKPRRGLASAGNWIVDHLKIVDVWPQPGNLANILHEDYGTGGAPMNVIIDLGRLAPELPLEAIGLVGDDNDGRWVMEQVKCFANCNYDQLAIHPTAQTSYTDVMTVQATGARTFFHLRGANSHLDLEHVDIGALKAKIFHLGYLLLLTRLDEEDEAFGTRAARLLARAREEGMITSIDLVSVEGGRFRDVVTPALRFTDYCIINEVEAGGVAEMNLRGPDEKPDWGAIESAARRIAELGARLNVTLHLPEGAVSYDVEEDRVYRVESLKLPPGFIKGSAGAGDAFCAGMLLGLHEKWEIPRSLELAHAAAATCLRHPTCTGGTTTMEETMKLRKELKEG